MKAIVSDFATSTSGHGYVRIAESKSKIKRAFWIIFLLICNTGLIFSSYMVIEEFLKQTITTNFETAEINFNYPVITICPKLPYSLLKIQKALNTSSSEDIFSHYVANLLQNQPDKIFMMFGSRIIAASSPNISKFLVNMSDTFVICLITSSQYCVPFIKTVSFFAHQQCFSLIWNSTEMQKAGSLGSVYFVLFSENSLSPLINKEVAAMAQHLNPYYSIGFDVFIHARNVLPFENEGSAVKISPGKSYELWLTRHKSVSTNQLFHETRCVQESDYLTITSSMCKKYKFTLKGSQTLCNWKKMQDFIRQTCNCTWNDPCESRTTPPEASCLFEADLSTVTCVRNASSQFVLQKKCKTTCEKESFQIDTKESEISSAAYNSIIYTGVNTFLKNAKGGGLLEYFSYFVKNVNVTNDHLRRKKMIETLSPHFTLLSVYFSKGDTVTQKENIAASIYTTICNIGGNMGVWVGCSFITIAEFIGVLYQLIAHLIGRKSKINKTFVQRIEHNSNEKFAF